MGRRRKMPALLGTLLSLFLLLPALPAVEAQEAAFTLSASMSSFCYAPGESAYLDVRMDLPAEARESAVSLSLRVYPRAVTRSYLASLREGGKHYPIAEVRLDSIPPEEEWKGELYQVDPQTLGLSAGVYPFEVRAVQGGETLASDFNYLVIMDPGAGYPLNLSLLWTLDFLPSSDARGNALDGGLAAACSSSSPESGFLYSLTRAQKNNPEVPSSLILPYATYQNLESLAGAGSGEGEDVDKGAAEVLATLEELVGQGSVDLLNTTYSFADPDRIAAQAWEDYDPGGPGGEDDAARQVRLGMEGTKAMGSTSGGFAAPNLRLSDGMLQLIRRNELEFVVVGEEALRASEAGRTLLEGTTLSQPVNFVSSDGHLLKAFVRDEALYRLLEGSSQRDPAHAVQEIIAELAVLQREKPYAVRSCVLAFPPSMAPSRELLDKLYGSIKSCPWLKPRVLSDLDQDQFPLEGIAVQAPAYQPSPNAYEQQLGAVRRNALDFSRAIPADHPLRESLGRAVLVAQNYRFTEEKDTVAARAYLDSINSVIAGEISKVRIERKRSVTLSSTEGKLNVDVTSGLDYPLQATLSLENPSITFPDPEGNERAVTIEPRENRFTFSITTRRKGSFIVDINLKAGVLAIDNTSTTVNTSIINTLAIIGLACLSGIVILVALARRLMRRFREGKHSKGRAQE